MSTQPQAADPHVSQPIEGTSVEQVVSTSGPREVSMSALGERQRPVIDPRLRQDWRQISDEERRARHEEYKRAIAEIDAQDDTPEEVYDAVMRGIDEERRIQGRPPAFEGYY